MKTKEEYYEMVQELRKIAVDKRNQRCSCPEVKCEWHGKCLECVTIHRYYKDHVPNCFQQFMNEKIKALAAIGEMTTVKKETSPPEYWDYVKERDQE